MPRHFVRKFQIRSVVGLFVALVTILATSTFLAQGQTSNAGQASAELQRAPMNAGKKKKSGAVPQDSGNPFFLPAVIYDTGGTSPQEVVVADVNGDGIPDLLVANYCVAGGGNCALAPGSVSVLLGNGDGTFQPALIFASGGYWPSYLAVTDVNGDGIPDIVVSNSCAGLTYSACEADGSVSILLGNGDGTFQPAVSYDSGDQGAGAVALADLNGDGIPDIVVTNNGVGFPAVSMVGVLLGNGDGTFQPVVTYNLTQFFGAGSASGIALADLNHDGILDIVAGIGSSNPLRYPGAVVVLLGNGDGTFSPQNAYDVPGSPVLATTIADVNGNGIPDILAAFNPDTDTGGLEVLGLQGNPSHTYGLAQNASTITVSDVNADGNPDLVVGTAICTAEPPCNGPITGAVAVLFGNGNGTFQIPVFYSPAGAFAAVADLNNDGKLDVVATSQNGVGVLLNNRQGPPYISTTTAVVSSANPAARKQQVTYTATVTSPSGGAVSGTVTFQENTYVDGYIVFQAVVSQPLVNNQATWGPESYTKTGYRTITAEYSGDAVNGYSSSPVLSQYIGNLPVATSTKITSSASHLVYGQAVTFTASIRWGGGTVPNGESVTFYDGTNPIGTGTTAGGIATFTTSSLAAGTHTIGASYPGDGTFKPSKGKITQVVSAPPVETKTEVTTSGSPSLSGQPVTFTATVTSQYGAIPNGEVVTFYDGSTEIGTGTTASGVASFTTSSLTVKTHHIKATYAGDGTFEPSTGKVTQVVDN